MRDTRTPTEPGLLPAGWEVKPLAEVMEILDTLRRPLNSAERRRAPGPYPYYGANGAVDRISRWIFDEPLLLMAEDGGHFDDYKNRPIAYLVEGKCWVNNHAHVLRVREGHDRLWVFYALVHRDIRPYINAGTRSKLNQAELRRIPIPLPALSEQRKIAAILSSVDETIEKTQAVLDQLDVVSEAMRADLLTRGLPGRHTRLKQTEVGEVPEGWEVVKLGEVTSQITDGAHKTPAYTPSGVPFLSVSNLRGGSLNYKTDKFISEEEHRRLIQRCHPRRGDLLLGKVATLGVVDVVDVDHEFSIFVQLALIRPRARAMSHFLKHAIRRAPSQAWIHAHSSGTGMKYIGIGALSELPVPLPPLDEQDQICRLLSGMADRTAAEARVKEQLLATKSALMSALLTGAIRAAPEEPA